jgi:hypothetical protein
LLAFAMTASLLVFPAAASNKTASSNREEQVGIANKMGQALSAHTPQEPSATIDARAHEAYGNLGPQFETNHGQSDERVKFITRAGGATIFLAATEAVFVLSAPDESAAMTQTDRASRAAGELEQAPAQPRMHALRMKIEGANEVAQIEGMDKLPGIVNYFIGNDPDKWHANIPTFGRVRYGSIYDGIDLVYYGNAHRQLEYDFVVKPGADAAQVGLSFEGADSVAVDAATGDLLVETSVGVVRQRRPVVYQETNGERREIESSYELRGGNHVGFHIRAYDLSKPLIIDPVLVYSTYLGGGGDDSGNSIAVDSTRNVYVTGFTQSVNFPTKAGALDTTLGGFSDAFVTKLNAAGTSLVYSTYLGGSGFETGSGIAVGSLGNAYVTGQTDSDNFPLATALQGVRGGQEDVFVTELSVSGAGLVYSTYLGGSSGDFGNAIAVDSSSAYVTGLTVSSNFPTTPGAFDTTLGSSDAFVTKLNSTGSALSYSTFVGGSSGERGAGIAVDSAGNAYITGRASPGFPTTPGAVQNISGGGIDAFVTKLNAAGSALVYSSFLGGSSSEIGLGIAVDSSGNAYVTGQTSSPNFPTVGAIQSTRSGGSDAFVTKLNSTGSALSYSTYLGGNGTGSSAFGDSASGIAVDSSGNAYVTGQTDSTNFPTSPGTFQETIGGGSNDAFVTKLNAAGSVLAYSTYLGGTDLDGCSGIAVDSAGNAYVTGLTTSTDFPTANAIQPTFGSATSSSGDAFIAKVQIINHSISGRVLDSSGNGIASVTVTLSGWNSAVTQTDALGNFSFLTNAAGGEYNVTPFKEDVTFSPETIHIFDLDSDRNLIFIGSGPTGAAARVQFEFANYIAAEDCDGFDIAVTRTGDVSGAVTIDYATSDGTAKQKGDYGIALGTISFAPGDTRKIITLPITEDALVEGDENFTLNLFNLVGPATLEEPSRATVTITDDDNTPTNLNPIDDTEAFVCQHYHDFLNREPDTAGELYWINNIESCGANASCRELKRIDTSAAFFLSIEFQATGFYAIRLRRAAFGKRSDTATTRMTYQDLVHDTRQLGEGVIVGEAGAAAKLEQNKQAYATQVVSSAAFIDRNPISQTAAQYVDALYASAQVTPTASERSDAITAFGAGDTAGRVAALRKVAETQSIVNAELNAAFVLLQYHGYLRRNPTDLPDTNDSGYQFWLTKLNSFGGDFRRAEMVKSFLVSAEYRSRFGQP